MIEATDYPLTTARKEVIEEDEGIFEGLERIEEDERKDDYEKWFSKMKDWQNVSLMDDNKRMTMDFGKQPSFFFDMNAQTEERKDIQDYESTLRVEEYTELSRTIVGKYATPRLERRTSVVGGLIRDKTLKAFLKSGKEKGINEKQVRALNDSSILAFNNNFL